MTIHDCAVSHDLQWLATCSRDRTLKVWNYVTGKLRYSCSRNNTIQPVVCVDISKTGYVAAGEADGTITVRNLDDGSEHQRYMAHDDTVLFLHYTKDGNTLISGSKDATIKFWDAHSGQLRSEIEAPSSSLLQFSFAAQEKRLSALSDDGRVFIWELAPSEMTRTANQ